MSTHSFPTRRAVELNPTPFWSLFAVQNANKASTRGVELELAGSAGEGFTYSLGYTYTDAQLEADAVAVDRAYLYGYKGDPLPGVPTHRFPAAGRSGIPVGRGLLPPPADPVGRASCWGGEGEDG